MPSSACPARSVDLRFSERTTLPEGKVMYYRASRDIHSQEHPEAFSLSINLSWDRRLPSRRTSTSSIWRPGRSDVTSGGGTASRVMPCRLARYVGDHRTAEALEPIAARHPTPRIRVTALESLAVLGAIRRDNSGDAAKPTATRSCGCALERRWPISTAQCEAVTIVAAPPNAATCPGCARRTAPE